MIQRCDSSPEPAYLTPKQVAYLTGFTEKALSAMRDRRTGPPYYKQGRSVRYRTDDVRSWIEAGGPVR